MVYQYIDRQLTIIWLALLLFGVVMQFSVDEDFRALRHIQYAGLALVAFCCVTTVPTNRWQQLSKFAMPLALVVAIVVLIPGIGYSNNGARQWIRMPFYNAHASTLILWLSLLCFAGRVAAGSRSSSMSKSPAIVFIIAFSALLVLVAAQPDFGTVWTLIATASFLFFASGTRLGIFAAGLIAAVLGIAALSILEPYRLARLTGFLNPWEDPFGAGYQLTQSLTAFGAGELFGVGYGNSVLKLGYLPGSESDFILPVVAEEFGALGAIVLLGALSYLSLRTWALAHLADLSGSVFAASLARGIAILLSLNTLLHASSTTGLIPTAGFLLPFISYGGNNLVAFSVMIAMVARIELDRRAGILGKGRPSASKMHP
jgi:cell division protein FtsW